jgi:hypothetical protein
MAQAQESELRRRVYAHRTFSKEVRAIPPFALGGARRMELILVSTCARRECGTSASVSVSASERRRAVVKGSMCRAPQCS